MAVWRGLPYGHIVGGALEHWGVVIAVLHGYKDLCCACHLRHCMGRIVRSLDSERKGLVKLIVNRTTHNNITVCFNLEGEVCWYRGVERVH